MSPGTARRLGLAGVAVLAAAAVLAWSRPHATLPSHAAARPAGPVVRVDVMEEGGGWRPIRGAVAAKDGALGCAINFRAHNSGPKRIDIYWRGSQARIPSGWWLMIGPNYLVSHVDPGGTLRESNSVSTSCKRRRRYRMSLVYNAGPSQQKNTLYKPSASTWYASGTTTIDLGDLYAPFK